MWACNHAFMEHQDMPRLTAVGTIHPKVAKEAIEYRDLFGLKYEVRYSLPDKARVDGAVSFQKTRRGLSTGVMMMQDSILLGYEHPICIGFDWGGMSTYGYKHPLNRFHEHYLLLMKENPDAEFEFVHD